MSSRSPDLTAHQKLYYHANSSCEIFGLSFTLIFSEIMILYYFKQLNPVTGQAMGSSLTGITEALEGLLGIQGHWQKI